MLLFEHETERKRTKAEGELFQGEVSVVIRIKGIKYILQLLRT